MGTAAWKQNDGRPERVSADLVDFVLKVVPAPAKRAKRHHAKHHAKHPKPKHHTRNHKHG